MIAWLRRHFVPHTGNDYSPHFLQKTAMGGMLLLILLSFTMTNIQSFLWQTSDWLVSTILPAVLVSETNEARLDEALPGLVRSDVLDKAAELKAKHMAENEYFSHFAPDGTSPWYWFNEVDYSYLHAGENLAIHFTDSSMVVDAWMKSPLHRDNILNKKYQEIGIGTYEGVYQGFPTVFVVQLFGTQLDTAATAALATEEIVNVVPVEVVGTTPEAVVLAESTSLELDSSLDNEESTGEEGVLDEVVESPVVEKEILEPGQDKRILSHLATSTAGVPLYVGQTTMGGESTVATFSLVTQPSKVLEFLYLILGTLVLLAITLSIAIEVKHQRPVQLMYGLGLFAFMMLLFVLQLSLTNDVLIV